jgi:hypothetical protein
MITIGTTQGNGVSNIEVQTTDKYGNVLPTIIVTPDSSNINWKSYDFSDLFMSQMGSPSGTIDTAITNLVDDLIQAGIWEKLDVLLPFVGGNSTDHSLNLKYPFQNQNSFKPQFVGSPTHNSNGLVNANINMYIKFNFNPCFLDMHLDGHFSLYYRTHTAVNNQYEVIYSGDSRQGAWFLNMPNAGSGTNGMSMCSVLNQVNPSSALTLTGHWLLNRTSNTTLRQVRNGVLDRSITNNSSGPYYDSGGGTYGCIAMGLGDKNIALVSIGKGLTAQNEADFYNIVQAFQTSLGRNV